MSITAIAWARRLELTPRDKFVLIALADHHNESEDAAWMRQETLADWTCYGRDTVNLALKALEELGLITSQRRRYADGRNATKIYRINFEAGRAFLLKRYSPNRVGESDTAGAPDSVGQSDTDSVGQSDSKNYEHRTRSSGAKAPDAPGPETRAPGRQDPESPDPGPSPERPKKVRPLGEFFGAVPKIWNDERHRSWPELKRVSKRGGKYVKEFFEHFDGDPEVAAQQFRAAVRWAVKHETWWHDQPRQTFDQMAANNKLESYAEKAAHEPAVSAGASQEGASSPAGGLEGQMVMLKAGWTARLGNLKGNMVWVEQFFDPTDKGLTPPEPCWIEQSEVLQEAVLQADLTEEALDHDW